MRHRFLQFITSHLGNGLALWLVFVAVSTMHICERTVAPEIYPGADMRTVTELRDATEHFSTPGDYVLHAPGVSPDSCATCEAQAMAMGELDSTPTGSMQDFYHRDAAPPEDGVAIAMTAPAAPDAGPPVVRDGRTVDVDPPPPQTVGASHTHHA